MWFVFNTFSKCHIKYSCKPSILFILWSPTIVSAFCKKFIFLNFPKCHSDIFVCPSFFSEVFSSSGKWHATITVSQYSYLCKRSVSDHLFFFMAESHLFSSNSAVSLVVCFINDPLVSFFGVFGPSSKQFLHLPTFGLKGGLAMVCRHWNRPPLRHESGQQGCAGPLRFISIFLKRHLCPSPPLSSKLHACPNKRPGLSLATAPPQKAPLK